MAARPPRGYWLRRTNVTGYSPYSEVLALPEAHERIVESDLDELFPRATREAVVARGDRRAMTLLLTLSFVLDARRSAEAHVE